MEIWQRKDISSKIRLQSLAEYDSTDAEVRKAYEIVTAMNYTVPAVRTLRAGMVFAAPLWSVLAFSFLRQYRTPLLQNVVDGNKRR